MQRDISSINFTVTTFCSMKCPDCCCNITMMKNKDKKFFYWDYFVNSAKYFYGIDRIHLTGGEPTLHPNFIEYVPKLKELFGCNRLTVETNGFGFKRFPETFSFFDEIYCSHYTSTSFEGSPDNTEEIQFIKNLYPDKTIFVGEITHLSRELRGTKMCSRGWSETVGYSNGKLYPCCVASGLPERDVGIELTESWKEDILKVIHPCDICFFAVN